MNRRAIALLVFSVAVGIAGIVMIRGKGGTVLGQGAAPKPSPDREVRATPAPAGASQADCNAARAQLEAIVKSQPAGTFGMPSLDFDCDRGVILIRVFVRDGWLDRTDIATVRETLRCYGDLSTKGLFENWRIRKAMVTKAAKCSVEFFTIRKGVETTIATYDPDRDELELTR